MPDVRQVPWPAPRHDEQRIDAHVVTVTHVAGSETLGSHHHAAQPPLVERKCRRFLGCALLHLDKGEYLATARDDIDLAARNASAALEDSPALQPQVPAGKAFRPPPAFLGGLAVQFRRSSARA